MARLIPSLDSIQERILKGAVLESDADDLVTHAVTERSLRETAEKMLGERDSTIAELEGQLAKTKAALGMAETNLGVLQGQTVKCLDLHEVERIERENMGRLSKPALGDAPAVKGS